MIEEDKDWSFRESFGRCWLRFIADLEGLTFQPQPFILQCWPTREEAHLVPRPVGGKKLEQRRKHNQALIEIAKPCLESLSLSLANFPHLVFLYDCDAIVLEVFGKTEGVLDEEERRRWGLCPGGNWMESAVGPNGAGTCLALDQPVVIMGEEECVIPFHGWSSFGVPLHDEERIIGALVMMVPREYGTPAKFVRVMEISHIIEREYKLRKLLLSMHEKSQEHLITAKVAAQAAHEIKNPLSTLRVIFQILQLVDNDPQTTRLAQGGICQVDRLSKLIGNIMMLVKPTYVKTEKIILAEIVEAVIAEYRPFLGDVELIWTNRAGDVSLEGNGDLLGVAIGNLCSNALDAMEGRGRLIIELDLLCDGVNLSVTDTGPGFPPELQNHFFEPFYTSKPEGTGLGLIIARQIVTITHRGQLGIESSSQGTKVNIWLPLSTAEKSPTVPARAQG
ncbi:MAG: ATP-binding protein [Limnochordia bacterium]|jgi:signal transduction histidine kinase